MTDMPKFRVWRDYKRDTEAEDGEEYEAISAEVAAVKFGDRQFSELQHVDPGGVFVRDLETNEVTRWGLRVIMRIDAAPAVMPRDFDAEPKFYGASSPSSNADKERET